MWYSWVDSNHRPPDPQSGRCVPMTSNDKPRPFTVTVVVGNTTIKVSLMLEPGTTVEQEPGVTVEVTPKSKAQRPGEDGAIRPLK